MGRNRRWPRIGSLLGAFAAGAAVLAATSHAGPLPPALAAKMTPRMAAAAAAAPGTAGFGTAPVAVWIELRDKGERDPASLARMLDRARAELTPRALARRLRAGVEPLVDYRDLPVHVPYLEALRARGYQTYGVSRWLNHVAVRVPPDRFADLASLDYVRWLEPVERGVRSEDPLPPAGELGAALPLASGPAAGGAEEARAAVNYGLTAAQLNQVNLPALHNLGYIGTGVLICDLDDGFNHYRDHQALSPQVIQPGRVRDFVDGDWDVENLAALFPDFQHGSWTFGLVGANRPGSYVGAAFGAQFALGRTENDFSEHMIEMVNWGMGAEWADSMGADIITSSLGYNTFDTPDTNYTYANMDGHHTVITRAAEIAASKGILVVTAAGNEGQDAAWGGHIVAPADANGDSVIAIGGVNGSGTILGFSSKGPTADGRIKPDLCALAQSNPLANVNAPFNPAAYTNLNGTSFSTPIVAGVAACLMQAYPNLSPTQIILALRSTASRAGSPDNSYGYGIPDALAAFNWIAGTTDVTGPPFAIRLSGPNPLRAGQSALLDVSPGADGMHAATVRVLDAQGRVVRHLWSGGLDALAATGVRWDGRDDQGDYAPPGLYFAALESAGLQSVARLVFLR